MDFKKYEPFKDKPHEYSIKIQSQLYEQFREDALKAVGLWGHRKADTVFAIAWKAYQFGLEEVYIHLDMMSDMILDSEMETLGPSKVNN